MPDTHVTTVCAGCSVTLCDNPDCPDSTHAGRPLQVGGETWCDECAIEPALRAAEAEIVRLNDANQRLHDLVRFARWKLHDAELLTDAEFNALAADHGAVARLEGYDALRARVDALTKERDHAVLCYNVAVRPSIAGPAMLDDDLPAEPTYEMKVRSLHIRAAFWTLATLAQAHPAAVNHLAFGLTMPTPPDAAPDEMKALAGWCLEVAAVKPGGKGPAKMHEEAAAERDALAARLADQEAQLAWEVLGGSPWIVEKRSAEAPRLECRRCGATDTKGLPIKFDDIDGYRRENARYSRFIDHHKNCKEPTC